MDNHGNRELNHRLNVVRNTARIAMGDAERAAKWACSREATWTAKTTSDAYEAARGLHDTFYDWELHDIIEAEEELEAQEEERADYVFRVHSEIFPGR